MTQQRRTELQRTLIKLEQPYPKNDLIGSYADFLKIRDYLTCYQFNPVVFDHLVNLTASLWNTSGRISRLSLLQKTRQYFYIATSKVENYRKNGFSKEFSLKEKTRIELFELFRKTFEESHFISKSQLDDVRSICNSMLINLPLTRTAEEWLCANTSLSDKILNRVLRYPAKSAIISNWAKENFENDELRGRRAEMTGWILNEEPEFEIDEAILIDDFEYLNEMDLQAIQAYENPDGKPTATTPGTEENANKIDDVEWRQLLQSDSKYSALNKAVNMLEGSLGKMSIEEVSEDTWTMEELDRLPNLPEITEEENVVFPEYRGIRYENPEIKLNRRPYPVPVDHSKHLSIEIPDFNKLREIFYADLSKHQKLTMIWAIGYSHLDNNLKTSLIKKYYSEDTYYSVFKVAERNKNIALLKWLLTH